MAAHHSYWDQPCPSCGIVRTIRKDRPVTQCRSCAQKAKFANGMRKKKPKYGLGVKVDPIYKGCYSSYSKAKRRVKTNHHGAYANIEFRFESFDQWFAELGSRPEGMTVDRIDNDGHYEPGNVRWATHKEQTRNRSRNVMVEYNGEMLCMTDAAKASGIPYGTLEKRIKAGCPPSHLFIKGRWRYRNGALAPLDTLDRAKR